MEKAQPDRVDRGAPSLVRDNRGSAFGVLAVVSIAWGITAWTALDMSTGYAQLVMPLDAAWSWTNAIAVFTMWSIMMAAMMLPSALPMLLMFAAMARKRAGGSSSRLWFFAGYIAIWTAFSAAAASLQWLLQSYGLLEPMLLASVAPYLTASLLLLAGIVQFTPLKQACLAKCRSPLGFLVQEWREGARGAWRMGFRHGLFCVGCCWALMLLLFAFGVMNLLWVVLLATVVAVEKLAPGGARIARVLGMVMIAIGVVQLTGSLA